MCIRLRMQKQYEAGFYKSQSGQTNEVPATDGRGVVVVMNLQQQATFANVQFAPASPWVFWFFGFQMGPN